MYHRQEESTKKSMASSSARPAYRSMEEKCTTLRNLRPEVQSWFVKVLVAEKTPIRFMRWGRQQKLVFVDKEHESMQSIIYEQDVEQLDKVLELYKTYYVGNAKIREITGNTPVLGTSNHQMILSRSTYIRLTEEHEQLSIDNIYQLTPFAHFPELADVTNKQINLLCSVIHVFPPRFVERTKRNLQDFVVVNEERRALILTLWEEFLQNEAPYLTKNVHNMPILLGMRLSVNTFYGLSIGTIPSSIILFDPPIPQAEALRLWVKSNREYVDTVISQKMYEKAYQSVDQPLNFQIRKISQILSLTETFKSFWLKAQLKITDSQHCLYFFACPNCAKSCGAAYGYEFTCLYCNATSPGPKPLLRFQAELSDGTGILTVYVEHREAEMLLGMTGEELVEANEEGKHVSPNSINEKFKDLHFLFQVRTSRNEARGRIFVRNTIIACLPSSESSSTFRSSEEKNLSLHAQQELLTGIPMSESEASTSNTQKEHIPTTVFEHQLSSTAKRSLDFEGDITQKGPKHAKKG